MHSKHLQESLELEQEKLADLVLAEKLNKEKLEKAQFASEQAKAAVEAEMQACKLERERAQLADQAKSDADAKLVLEKELHEKARSYAEIEHKAHQLNRIKHQKVEALESTSRQRLADEEAVLRSTEEKLVQEQKLAKENQ